MTKACWLCHTQVVVDNDVLGDHELGVARSLPQQTGAPPGGAVAAASIALDGPLVNSGLPLQNHSSCRVLSSCSSVGSSDERDDYNNSVDSPPFCTCTHQDIDVSSFVESDFDI